MTDDSPLPDGMGLDMTPKSIAQNLRNPSDIAGMLTNTSATGDSAAEIFADIVNVHRADIRRLGMELGVDVEAGNMTEDKAARLLAGVVAGDGVELVVMFNEMAAKRDQLLQEVLSEEEHTEFMLAKHRMMNTSDPGEFEEE